MSINATLFVQAIVFAILVWFTMKFVWPPIANALDERAEKIASGLKAAEHAQIELTNAHKHVEVELAKNRSEAAARMAEVEQRALAIIEEAKLRATEEANKMQPEQKPSRLSCAGVISCAIKSRCWRSKVQSKFCAKR